MQPHLQVNTPLQNPTAIPSYVHIPKELKQPKFVFVRVDSVRKLLQPPYEGSFEVVKTSDKFFAIIVKTKRSNISVVRFKVTNVGKMTAHQSTTTMGANNNTNLPVQAQNSNLAPETNSHGYTTRAGRKVRFPTNRRDFLQYD
ncbi:hypothetical protein Zmor_003790 [Zophobas morio]|uniref:Uncharacterized protein n=1 Tax=Zophobas morio TaxID=2755281 RepID=A0AA38HP48_9CUCU|nr:hypothetical protein Zmor_003790 [Zophobas morio]